MIRTAESMLSLWSVMTKKVDHWMNKIVSEEANYRRLEGEHLDKFSI